MSQLKVNSIVPVGGLASGFNGGIIQMKQVYKQDTFSMNSNSMTDLTGMSVVITPSSSSNKILIVTNLTYGGQSNGYFGINLLRGSTSLGLSTAATGNQLNFSFAIGTGNGDNDYYKCHSASYAYLDSPATTSSTTYKLQAYSYDSRYFYLNRGHSTSNAAYIHRGSSSITAYEITT